MAEKKVEKESLTAEALQSKLENLKKEQMNQRFQHAAGQMPCQDVAVYCVSCVKSMAIGGKTPHYMVDLLLGEATDPQDLDLVRYHDAIDAYIERH